MKRLLMSALASYCICAYAEPPRAVEQTNGDIGLSFEDLRSAAGPNKTVGVNADVVFPLGAYLGLSLAGAAAKTNIDVAHRVSGSDTDSTPSCSIHDNDAQVGLFARNPTIGRIGVSYGIARLHSSCDGNSSFVATGDNSTDTRNYQVQGELYFDAFTVGASHTQTHLDGHGDLNTDLFSVSWYPVSNVRITPSAGRQDYNDAYGLALEAQPEFLSDSVSVLLSYSLVRQSSDVKAWTLGFVHHFGAPLELQTRDRNYR